MVQLSIQSYNSLQDSNSQTITDIINLQKVEKNLFDTLEQSLNQGTLTQTQKNTLVAQINDVSNMRANIYQTISGVNSFYTNNINLASDTLANQTGAIEIVEKELNAAKKRLQNIEEYKINKLRLVEINNYYSERYSAHTKIMKIIIAILVPILILAFLANKSIISNNVFSILTIIIGFVGIIILFYNIRSVWLRDNMMFQEYDWGFNPNTAPVSKTSSNIDPWAKSSGANMCVGQACCDIGYTYNSTQNKCIAST